MIIILKFVDEESCKYMKCHVCTLHCIVLLKLPLQHKAGVNGEPEGVHEVFCDTGTLWTHKCYHSYCTCTVVVT